MNRIKKGDNIVVIAGKDASRQAKVLRMLPKEAKLVAEGINLGKRRQRPRRQGEKGQVVQKALPVSVSNVLLWCSGCAKGVRTGSKMVKGKKVRICRKCEKEI